MAGSEFPLPRVLTYPSSTTPELITQGAEGRLYKTTYLLPSIPCALKHRPSKPYRHPVLDARLTRQRILAEARILARCRREGVSVPAVFAVDEANGWMMMEWIDGGPVRASINEWLLGKTEEDVRRDAEDKGAGSELADLMRRMGSAVGKLHRTGIVHGDLTTSNMMLRPWTTELTNRHGTLEGVLAGEIVLIDFGLASTSTSDEDRAVDLYVLERAFGSTHPRGESLFPELLHGYKEAFKQATPVLRKLEDVRMRGRKRSMLG